MRCNRCNKEIKNPGSIQHGYGTVCWAKIQKSHAEAEEKKRKENQRQIIQNFVTL